MPAPKVRRYDERNPNLLTADQLAAVMNAIPRSRFGLVALIVTTGLRWGEASALRWEDVDTRNGRITIRRNNWKGVEGAPKTAGSMRTVALLPEVAAAIGPRPARPGLVFPSETGELHRGSPLRRVLDRAVVKAGLAHVVGAGKARRIEGLRVTPHGLRRTFNDLARRSTSGEVLRSITGHMTPAMSEHYSLITLAEKAGTQRTVADAAGLTKPVN